MSFCLRVQLVLLADVHSVNYAESNTAPKESETLFWTPQAKNISLERLSRCVNFASRVVGTVAQWAELAN